MYKKEQFFTQKHGLTYFKWLHKISVEPTMLLYMLAFMITSVIEQAFFVYKSCRVNHGLSEELCSNLNQHFLLQKKVQLTVSEFHQWNNIAGHLVPIILAMFIGNWSDHYGRKMPLIVGLVGKLIYSLMLIVNSLIKSWNLQMIIFTASIPMGLLGGDIAIFASCFAYISDVTSLKERTLRVTLLDAIYLSSIPTGIAFGAFLYSSVVNGSFTAMFLINSFMILIAIIYSFYRLNWQTAPPQIEISWTNLFTDFFDKRHVYETIKTLFKKRNFHGRTILCTILVCMMLYTFQRDEKPMSYLYTQLKFHWSITEFSNFRSFYSALFVLAMIVTIPVMNKFLLLDDTYVVIIGALSHGLGRIFFAMAQSWQVFYIGAVFASFGPIAAPALRSITSKIVPSEERGKIFSILSVCDNAVPLLSGVLYTQLYNLSIETNPSLIFWMTFVSQIMVFIFILVTYHNY